VKSVTLPAIYSEMWIEVIFFNFSYVQLIANINHRAPEMKCKLQRTTDRDRGQLHGTNEPFLFFFLGFSFFFERKNEKPKKKYKKIV